ncbi:uncharacterized protein [Fopius arisanus]|uniref:Uncharacterized protein n=2 Tax=Fopius arisanus TaxID=64838 RepID=A0A9R1TFS3_9HYME|nr:PREDICTED: uncharacterized protein LOC105269547 [Fopius arisanus]
MGLFGVPATTPSGCLSAGGLQTMRNPSGICGPSIIKNIKLIENFANHIDSINKALCAVQLRYQNLTEEKVSIPFNETNFHLTDRLYEIVSDPSIHFFHAIAGEFFSQLGGKRPISTTYSSSGEIYHTYCVIAMTLLKGYVTESYNYHDNPNVRHRDKKIKFISTKFLMHVHNIAKLAITALKIASRDITLGEPSEFTHAKGSPYVELKWFVSQIIVSEANMHPQGTCQTQCDFYKESKYYPYGSTPSSQKDVCHGTMSQCRHQRLGWVCPADESSLRRYAGIKSSRREPWRSLGNTDNCSRGDEKHTFDMYEAIPNWFTRCLVCTCICDEHKNPETIRTFSLQEVETNIAENMVITGLRLVEINGTIHIQRQEGKLKGLYAVESPSWIPVDASIKRNKKGCIKESFTLRFPDRAIVHLDTISTRDEFVIDRLTSNDPNYTISAVPYFLTGVKFGNDNGRLNFGIKLTAWDAKTQKLENIRFDNWIFNQESSSRKEINLENSDIPTKTRDNVEAEGPRYLMFQTTDNVKDFGQTTVPFLDFREVVSCPPMPLSGAGLFYKGKPGYGGVIGLKLVSMDFSPFVATELMDEEN